MHPIVVLLLAAIGAGQGLRPSQWTLEQRLEARFDESARPARVAAARTLRGSSQRGATPSDVVHGSDHPELLLPHEIVTSFVTAAYQNDDAASQNFRRDAAAQALSLGLPADFMETFEREAREFITLHNQELLLRKKMSGAPNHVQLFAEIQQLVDAECQPRAAMIARLRATFGTRFDEFLYSALAPNVFYDFFGDQNRALLRQREEGCQ